MILHIMCSDWSNKRYQAAQRIAAGLEYLHSPFEWRKGQKHLIGCLAVQPASLPTAGPEGVLSGSGREVVQLYRTPGLSASAATSLLRTAQQKISGSITGIDTELVRHLLLQVLNL